MTVGVVSDTHSRELPQQMLDHFKKVDLIVHAGDFCSKDDLKKFKQIKQVEGVYGNMDGPDVRELLPRRQIFKLGRFLVGLFHGEGPREGILERVKAEFAQDKVDCIIFGHSHQPLNEKIGDILYFNPGSPNDTVFAPYCSYGILEINRKEIKGNLIKVIPHQGF